jgi:geranylgeranyl pyrophosphate synthase
MTKLPHSFDPERGGGFGAPEHLISLEAHVKGYVPQINDRLQLLNSNERKIAEAERDPMARATALANLSILEAASSRKRGALTMFAHLDWGVGGDYDTGLAAAVHTEMGQASFVILDDVHDGARVRREGKTAHLQVEADLEHERNSWGTRPPMTKVAIEHATMLQAVAYQILSYSKPFADLPVRPRYLSQAMDKSAEITAITAQGQIKDISNRRNPHITEAELLELYVEKTALYTFAAPLIVGKTLADGPLSDLELHYIYEFAKPAGRAFQLKNDQKIMEPSDKPEEEILLDIRNGTMTPLVLHALNSDGRNNRTGTRIFQADRDSLWQMLNGRRPSLSRVRAILQDSGAVDHVQELIEQQKAQAQVVLDEAADRCKWPADVVSFLRQLA